VAVTARKGPSTEARSSTQPAAEATPEREIAELRAARATTKRATVPALEDVLYQPVRVLDHGFVRVVDYFGDDSAIVQAARVSYGKGTKRMSDDRNLIRYLMRHRHSTPFEMCEIKLHIKLPFFVARQWIRHRTANVNEYSARYSILDKEFYVPDSEYLKGRRVEKKQNRKQMQMFDDGQTAKPSVVAAQSTTNRQGRDEQGLDAAEADESLEAIRSVSSRAYSVYMKLLNEDLDGNVVNDKRHGVARELARMVLPMNYYTQWYWKIDLQNLFHFLSLRADPHAQYEIRVYAEAIAELVEKWCPLAFEAFRDYRMTGSAISGPGMQVIKRLLSGEAVTQAESGLSKREWGELMAVLGRDN
jgi:thymidylate synthase (FAD)